MAGRPAADSRDERGAGVGIRAGEYDDSPARENVSVSETARPLFAGMKPGIAVEIGGKATFGLSWPFEEPGEFRARETVGERELLDLSCWGGNGAYGDIEDDDADLGDMSLPRVDCTA